jgi:two-component system cell cycle response regulator
MSLKILTVDDSKTIRMIVTRAFKPYDCEVTEAANGVEGLAEAVRKKPDLIILDLTMPIMDGAEMLSKVKSNAELKNIPVIMLTAEAGRDNVVKIAKMGVRDYLVKPFKEELLVERVGRVIDLKPKGEAADRAKRFDAPLNILLVDDKPAILEQIQAGLKGTGWTAHGRAQSGAAVDFCSQNSPDVILISLSLPDNGAFTLFQVFRASAKTKNAPIFALSVKTATEEQARAQQSGFTGIITKPIDFEDLRGKITRALHLDTSYKYFEQKNGCLFLRVPGQFTPGIANEISAHLRAKVAEAVDAGLGSMIIDFSQLRAADLNAIQLGLAVIELCEELSLKQRIVCGDLFAAECKNYEETRGWSIVATMEEAVATFSAPAALQAV